MSEKRRNLLTLLGPGILVAATGVGAGDLATASLVGNKLGVAVLWAVLLGAGLKFVLNEGIARWQLATGSTVLEGTVTHFGRAVQYAFLAYLVCWSYFVGAALISACGVAAHALVPVFGDARTGKICFGVLHSLIGLGLVLWGGYRLFEKVMSACIAVMFVTAVVTMFAVQPHWPSVARGLCWPTVPDAGGQGLAMTIALMGGVGGTLTVLCYGYWIREEGRSGPQDLKLCRIDLATGYAMTAVFGVAMVVIGHSLPDQGDAKGATLVVDMARRLDEVGLGNLRWPFLLGAWGAVFSSLLGVWQSVPYLFADFCLLLRHDGTADARHAVDTTSRTYRGYMLAIAIVPMAGLYFSFSQVQLVYAVVGAAFIPILALALLVLNGRRAWVGALQNRWLTALVLGLTVICFAVAAGFEIKNKLGW